VCINAPFFLTKTEENTNPMKTTLKHQKTSYPANPEILIILVQKKAAKKKKRNSRHIPCPDWILHVTVTF